MAYDESLSEFYALLDACNDPNVSKREEAEARLWSRFGAEKTVLVLDMAGFTTKVQKHGLLFFLRKIRYMQKIVAPILETWKGELVKFEADNGYCVFNNKVDAVYCALEIHQTFADLCNGLPDVDNVQVGIGIAHGKILLIPQHDFFGDAVNLAAKLGEDVADDGETLVSNTLFLEIESQEKLGLEPLNFSVSGLQLEAGRVFIAVDRFS